MNHAYDTWSTDGDPRWDASASGNDPTALAQNASEAAARMRIGVLGFESALSGNNPQQRAWMRNRYAPMYYDLHRAERASDPANAQQHVATMKLARAMAEKAPATLAAARSSFADLAPRADIDREYMLWKHSLHLTHPMAWPSHEIVDVANLSSLVPRNYTDNDVEGLDANLRDTYGDHTRGPWAARVGFADAAHHGPVRGTTIYPSGHMLVGTLPGKDEKTYHDNRKTQVEEMAHSLLQRHYRGERDRYNKWIKMRTSGHEDPRRHLSSFAHPMMLPERNDYSEELAHAMAHGVFDQPSMHPESREAPSDEAVAFAGRLFRREPSRSATSFRFLGP